MTSPFHQRALTLIEFLLAFAIFSTVSLSLYGTFYSGLQINKRAKNFEHFFRGLQWSLQTIQSDVENMVPYHQNTQESTPSAFSGNDQEFSLILATDSGLKRIRYHLLEEAQVRVHTVRLGTRTSKNVSVRTGETANENRTIFLMRQQQGLGQSSPEDEVLYKHVVKGSFKISYARMDKDTLVWVDAWKDSLLPAGIRVQMECLDPDDPKHKISIQKTFLVPLGLWGKI